MITPEPRRSLTRGNTLVPSRWQATVTQRGSELGPAAAGAAAILSATGAGTASSSNGQYRMRRPVLGAGPGDPVIGERPGWGCQVGDARVSYGPRSGPGGGPVRTRWAQPSVQSPFSCLVWTGRDIARSAR